MPPLCLAACRRWGGWLGKAVQAIPAGGLPSRLFLWSHITAFFFFLSERFLNWSVLRFFRDLIEDIIIII